MILHSTRPTKPTTPEGTIAATSGLLLVFLASALPVTPTLRAQDGFVRGDTNADRKLDVTDPIATLNFSFRGGSEPPCLDAADANDDGDVDLSDAVYALSFLFLGAEAPPIPYPDAGGDPTDDSLSCASLETADEALIIGLKNTPSDSIDEFWVSIEEITVDTEQGPLAVFPPIGAPTDARIRMDLLALGHRTALLAMMGSSAQEHQGVTLTYDGAGARVEDRDVTVVPDHGTLNLTVISKAASDVDGPTVLVVDVDLSRSLDLLDSGDLDFAPVVAAIETGDPEGMEFSEFHGTIVSIDVEGSSLLVEVTSRQDSGETVGLGEVVVLIDESTEFDDDVHGAAGLELLEVGQDVEIEGTLQEDGSVLAREIETLESDTGEDLDDDGVPDDMEDPGNDTDDDNDGVPDEDDEDHSEFHGTVVSVDLEGASFVVDVSEHDQDGAPVPAGPLTVIVNETTEFDHGPDGALGLVTISAGHRVEVEGTLLEDGTFQALEVEVEAEHGGGIENDGRFDLRGRVVSTDTEAGSFVLDSRERGEVTVLVNDATSYRGAPGGLESVEENDRLRARGLITDDGVFLARRVRVEDRDDDDDDDDDERTEVELLARVTSTDLEASTFVVESADVGSVTVLVDESTEFDGGLTGLADLSEGDLVEIEGTPTEDGAILAREVELEDDDG